LLEKGRANTFTLGVNAFTETNSVADVCFEVTIPSATWHMRVLHVHAFLLYINNHISKMRTIIRIS